MRLLILGAGVIGATYGWQLAEAGHDVTLFVRKEKNAIYQQNGIAISCRDERRKAQKTVETVFRPAFTSELSPADNYGLIVVCVRSNQLDDVLPLLAEMSRGADILFLQNNWWGDSVITRFLPAEQVFYGFARLASGWRKGIAVTSTIFDGQSTMLGEKDGAITPRLQKVRDILDGAGLRPEVSKDILGWLMAHYVEYLGPVGNILKVGSAERFAGNKDLIEDAILATREGLDVCRARGLDINKSAPVNLRMLYLPTAITVPLGRMQYGQANTQQFFDENIEYGMSELAAQYFDVVHEGRRLGVDMPHLEALEDTIRNTARRTLMLGQRSPFADDHTITG